jgi:hypothetical protein
METQEIALHDALNIERGEYVHNVAAQMFNECDRSSDAIKRIMCSDLDTKECLLACYFLGRMRERCETDMNGHIDAMFQQFFKAMGK